MKWGGSLFQFIQEVTLLLKKKKKKELEINCELKLDRYTYYHIHEIDIKDYGINPSTYIEIKREKRKEIKKR